MGFAKIFIGIEPSGARPSLEGNDAWYDDTSSPLTLDPKSKPKWSSLSIGSYDNVVINSISKNRLLIGKNNIRNLRNMALYLGHDGSSFSLSDSFIDGDPFGFRFDISGATARAPNSTTDLDELCFGIYCSDSQGNVSPQTVVSGGTTYSDIVFAGLRMVISAREGSGYSREIRWEFVIFTNSTEFASSQDSNSFGMSILQTLKNKKNHGDDFLTSINFSAEFIPIAELFGLSEDGSDHEKIPININVRDVLMGISGFPAIGNKGAGGFISSKDDGNTYVDSIKILY